MQKIDYPYCTVSTLDDPVNLEGKSQVSIYYEDTDFSGFVYHANYLKFFERAREDLLGIEKLRDLFKNHGLHIVVAKLEIKYHLPAKHGDQLDITTKVSISKSPIMLFDHKAYLNGKDCCSAKVTTVFIDETQQPTRVDDETLRYLVD